MGNKVRAAHAFGMCVFVCNGGEGLKRKTVTWERTKTMKERLQQCVDILRQTDMVMSKYQLFSLP